MMGSPGKIIVLALCSATLASCGDSCSFELLATSEAPNSRAQAAFSRANCGATTGYRYEVRVSSVGNAATAGDIVLRFDDNHAENWPADDSKVLTMSWTTDRHLLITANLPIRVFAEESSTDDISIDVELPDGTVKL